MALKMEELERGLIYALFVGLVSLVAWIGSNQMGRLAKIEEQLTKIQLDLVALQSKMLDEARVKEIVKYELAKEFKEKR